MAKKNKVKIKYGDGSERVEIETGIGVVCGSGKDGRVESGTESESKSCTHVGTASGSENVVNRQSPRPEPNKEEEEAHQQTGEENPDLVDFFSRVFHCTARVIHVGKSWIMVVFDGADRRMMHAALINNLKVLNDCITTPIIIPYFLELGGTDGTMMPAALINYLKLLNDTPFIIPYFLELGAEISKFVVPTIHGNVDTWIKSKSTEWWNSKPEHQNETIRQMKGRWWEFLKDDFWVIFRDVTRGLNDMYCHKHYHGDLENGVVVTEKCRGRLMIMGCENLKFPEGVAKDLQSLKNLMKRTIGYPFKIDDVTSDHDFNEVLPNNLLKFMDLLDASNVRCRGSKFLVEPGFLIDSSFFWIASEKVQFMEEFSELVSRNIITSDFGRFFAQDSWHENLPSEGLLRTIYTIMLENDNDELKKRLEKRKKCRKVGINSFRMKKRKNIKEEVRGGDGNDDEGDGEDDEGKDAKCHDGSFVYDLHRGVTIYSFFGYVYKYYFEVSLLYGEQAHNQIYSKKSVEKLLSAVFPGLYERLREALCKWLLDANFKIGKRKFIERSLRTNIPKDGRMLSD